MRFAILLFLCVAVCQIGFGADHPPANPPVLTVQVDDYTGAPIISGSDPRAVTLTYGAVYRPGDTIAVSAPRQDKYLIIQVDDKVPESMVYAPTAWVNFPIPFGKFAISYDPLAFTGSTHHIKARLATPAEIAAYRNVAMNSLDQRYYSQYFPHAIANAVTREDPMFFERNAIDGNTRNQHHGAWPYESWGNNMDPHPTLKIDFGRDVTIDKVRLYIRADFPHDAYWSNMTIQFSDGSSKDITLQKTADPQDYTFPQKTVQWVQLANFKQASDPPGWASITEVEVYGKDAPTPQP